MKTLKSSVFRSGVPDKKRIDEVLKTVNLSDAGNKHFKNFSLGMKQRLGIANALLTTPEVMILDEPINGLDPQGIVEIRELLLKLNKVHHITIIISSHILSELSLLCTDYIFIDKGKVTQFIPADKLKSICRDYYKINTTNNAAAAAIISEKLGISDFEVEEDGHLRVYEGLDDIARISKCLYDNGVIPTMLSMNEITLEQYYMEMIGGENNVEHN